MPLLQKALFLLFNVPTNPLTGVGVLVGGLTSKGGTRPTEEMVGRGQRTLLQPNLYPVQIFAFTYAVFVWNQPKPRLCDFCIRCKGVQEALTALVELRAYTSELLFIHSRGVPGATCPPRRPINRQQVKRLTIEYRDLGIAAAGDQTLVLDP